MANIEALRRENDELKAELALVRKESTQYLQNVAHQLTAPLGAIKWSIEGLTMVGNVSIVKRQKLLSSIYSQATILVHLIKNFTLMSNLEVDHELGQFREQPEPVDLLRLCINLASDFQPQAADKGLKINVDEQSFHDIPKLKEIKIVKNLIAQAISNVLENAVKYSVEGSTIKLSVDKSDRVELFVESVGIPIKEDEKDKLFERNFRGVSAQQAVPAGTGIGLYLVARIMKLHKGDVSVETNGKKSSFIFGFPLKALS
jgi:signal transduction histidine kinase